MKLLYALLVTAILSIAPVLADTVYIDTACGTWINDVWIPNGRCAAESSSPRHDSVAGTITIVKGHLVTLQQSARALVINDQPALNAKQTGKVAVGREVV